MKIPGGNAALVGEISGDAALVLGPGPSDEGGVEDEPVLGRVALGLEGPEQRLLRPQDLDRAGRTLSQVGQGS